MTASEAVGRPLRLAMPRDIAELHRQFAVDVLERIQDVLDLAERLIEKFESELLEAYLIVEFPPRIQFGVGYQTRTRGFVSRE